MNYAVHVRQDWVYTIDADSPDDAASAFEYDPPDRGDCTGYSIEAVTTPDDWHGETDLREPLSCRGCAKTLPPTSNGECIKCLRARLDREAAARAVAAPVVRSVPQQPEKENR